MHAHFVLLVSALHTNHFHPSSKKWNALCIWSYQMEQFWQQQLVSWGPLTLLTTKKFKNSLGIRWVCLVWPPVLWSSSEFVIFSIVLLFLSAHLLLLTTWTFRCLWETWFLVTMANMFCHLELGNAMLPFGSWAVVKVRVQAVYSLWNTHQSFWNACVQVLMLLKEK